MNYYQEAVQRFKRLERRWLKAHLTEPTAMVLATADRQGHVSARVVLLKEMDAQGFVFYTNQLSRKGRDLKQNPSAALCFFWDPLDIQVRVEGRAVPISTTEADAYWFSRPRFSQIGAWASQQSAFLGNRATFLSRVKAFRKKFHNKQVPRPPHWSGFRIVPGKIEFWQKRAFRLHDRELYYKDGRQWKKTKLYP